MSVLIDLTDDDEGGGGGMVPSRFTCVKCSFINMIMFDKIRICKLCSTPYEEVVLDLTIDCDSPLLSTASDDTIPMIVIDCDDKSSEREHEKGIENKMRVEFPSSGSTSSNNDPEVEIRVDDFSPPKFPLIKSSVTPFDKSPASIYESTSSSNENLDNNFNKSSLSARSAEQILVLSTVEKLKLQYSEKINSQKNLGKDTRALQMIALNKEENKFLKNILELAKNPDSGFGFVNGDQDGWGNCQSSQSPSQSSQDSCASSHRDDCYVPQTHWLMRKASVLFIESQLEYCEKEGKILQFNEISKKRILPYLQTESLKYLKSF